MLHLRFVTDNKGQTSLQTDLHGKPLLTIPQLNKGTAFTQQERELFDLTGKLPAHIETLDEQVNRAYQQYLSFSTPLQKNVFLNKIHDTNLILFYKLVETHEGEMIPILYTPTVGEAVQKFSREFQQARGLYISYEHRHIIEEIFDNRSHPEIDLIVVSDGGGVLGIGDQGAGAMMIPVAKLMVYTICGGINPYRTLPIMLDVGTDNKALLDDPFYLGWRHPRISGKQYDEFIELFVTAIKKKFPDVFLHWEDFGRDNARKILMHYRNDLCTFNDDIQGTGAVTLAALLAAVMANKQKLKDQRIIVFGAGTAGTGISDQIVDALVRNDISLKDARKQFWLIDRPGLLTDHVELTNGQKPYARSTKEVSEWDVADVKHISFLEVINNVKPTILIGSSAVTGAFTKDIVKAMASHVKRPIIFPLSNPTERAEATPQDIVDWTQGNVLIATGSPFPKVTFKGKKIAIAQCNNALVYPGIGLGIVAVNASRLNDTMLYKACEALGKFSPIHKDPNAPLLPPMESAKAAARQVAIAVGEQARTEGLANEGKPVSELVDQIMWQPKYLALHKLP